MNRKTRYGSRTIKPRTKDPGKWFSDSRENPFELLGKKDESDSSSESDEAAAPPKEKTGEKRKSDEKQESDEKQKSDEKGI